MAKFVRILLVAVGVVCLFFAAIPPIMYRIFHIGVAALLVIAGLCFVEAWLMTDNNRKRSPWEVFARKGEVSAFFRRTLAVLLVLFLVAEVALSVPMYLSGWRNRPTMQSADTAIVLGALIKGDQPSLMLRNRLEQALVYLNAVPEAKVVVTGGQGAVEDFTEASVEAKWLMERGIDEQRIIIEDKSQDTYENLQNAVTLMLENNLSLNVIVFTDGFHQLRGQQYARLAIAKTGGAPDRSRFFGAAVSGVPSGTPWGLFPSYWLREQAALAEALLLTELRQIYMSWL